MPAFPKPTATETDPVAGPNLTTHAALTTTAHGGIVASNDSRLTDARTPTAHKTTHATGQSDALAPSDIGAATAAAAAAAQSTADGAVVLAETNAAAVASTQKLRSNGLRGYGSSLLVLGTDYNPRVADRWSSRLAGLLGAYERNYGVAGSKLIFEGATNGWAQRHQHMFDVLPSSEPQDNTLLAQEGVHLLCHAFNEARLYGDKSTFLDTYEASVRAWVRESRANFAWRSSASVFTLTGWSSNAGGTGTGGSYHEKASSGAIVQTLGSGNLGGTLTFYFMVYLNEAATDVRRFRARAKIGAGSYVATLDAASPALGIAGSSTLVCLEVPNVPAGATTVTVDIDQIGTGGRCQFMGSSMEIAGQQGVCLLVGSPATPAMPYGGTSFWDTTVKNNVNAKMSTVASSFSDGLVKFVDLRPLLELGGDGLGDPVYFADDCHYSAQGSKVIADACRDAIIAVGGVPQAGPGKYNLTSGSPGWSSVPGETAFDPATGIKYVAGGTNGYTWVQATAPVHASRHVVGGADPLSLAQYDEDVGFARVCAPTIRQPGVAISSISMTAQRLCVQRFRPSRAMAITAIGFETVGNDTADNAVHVGLVDSTGAILATSGAVTGKLNAARFSLVSLGSTVNLTAGQVYGACLLVPTITTSLSIRGASLGSGSYYGGMVLADGASAAKFPTGYWSTWNSQTVIGALTLGSLSGQQAGPVLFVAES